MTRYYLLSTTSTRYCTYVDELYETLLGKAICRECYGTLPHIKQIDVYLDEVPKGPAAINTVVLTNITLIKRDFLYCFSEDVINNDLFVGEVYGPKGNLLDNWLSIRGQRQVIIRGSEEVGYYQCCECGRHVYSSYDHSYLYSAPPVKASIYGIENQGGELVVTEEFISKIDLTKWKGISLEEIPVFDKPKDGLPILLPLSDRVNRK